MLINKHANFYYTLSVLIIVVVAFLIRAYISFYGKLPWFSEDSYSYMKMANAILAGKPFAQYPNGLPMLIALLRYFFSEKTAFVVIFLNVIFSTTVVLMTIILTKYISGERILGVAAGVLILLYPNQLNYVRFILTETPACFFLTSSIALFIFEKYFFSGILLFIAGLFRADLLLVFPFIMLVGILYFYKVGKIKRLFIYILGYSLCSIAYFFIVHAGIVSSANRDGLEVLKSINSDSLQEKYRSVSNFSTEQKEHPVKTYIHFILMHPGEFSIQRLSALENMWGWPPAETRSLSAKLLIFVRLPLFILALLGFWRHKHKFNAFILIIPVAALTIVHVASYSSPRYTFMAEPFVICLACLAFSRRKVFITRHE